MNLLDLLKKARLATGTPNGNRPSNVYQDGIAKMRNVRFPPTISPGANYDSFVRYEETGTVPGSPAPVAVTYYMVTENDNFLMTEDNNNLITGTDIV